MITEIIFVFHVPLHENRVKRVLCYPCSTFIVVILNAKIVRFIGISV